MTELVWPSVVYERSYLEARAEAPGDEASWADAASRLSDFESLVDWLVGQAKGRGLPPGWVASSHLWLVDDGEYVGRVSIRHELNDWLRTIGGHIGYYVRPSKRRRGYGREALRLGLIEAAASVGLRRVLVTCAEDNVGSRRIIESNGGLYESSIDGTRRYWFEL